MKSCRRTLALIHIWTKSTARWLIRSFRCLSRGVPQFEATRGTQKSRRSRRSSSGTNIMSDWRTGPPTVKFRRRPSTEGVANSRLRKFNTLSATFPVDCRCRQRLQKSGRRCISVSWTKLDVPPKPAEVGERSFPCAVRSASLVLTRMRRIPQLEPFAQPSG